MRSATRHHLLLACAAVMAACPIISTSRGGAMVTVGLVLAAALFMAWAQFFFEEPGRLRIKVRIPRSAVRGQGTASRERGAGSKVQRDAQAPPSPGGEGQGEGGPTSNIEHPTSNIQHPTVEPEEKGGPTTNLEPRTLNLEPRTSEAVEGTPSPGGEGEGGTITNTEHPTSNLEHRTATAARVDGGPMPKIENQKSGQGLVLLCLAAALILGYALGWKALRPRMAQLSEGFEGREQMYDAARPMAADYPVFGTGPGTFESVFQLYRITTDTYWPAQLHNDWLETRITFGWVGCGLIGLALAIVVMRWFGRGGIPGGRRFTFLIWLALAGCLIHARYDFPFQIYSIVFLFLVLCAVLFNLSRRA